MSEELLKRLAQVIVDKKGFNVIALDVRGISCLTDYFLIAEGRVARHVKALAEALLEEVEEARVEGLQSGEWVVVDCWDIVIHLFIPELRQRYQIERIWEEAKLVELDLSFPKKENSAINLL